jgi:hypothetical protein
LWFLCVVWVWVDENNGCEGGRWTGLVASTSYFVS